MKSYLLELENITGDDLRSINLEETAITEDNSLKSQSLLQFIDNRTSLVFLDETNTSVEQEETANNTEIDPILKTGSQESGSLKK